MQISPHIPMKMPPDCRDVVSRMGIRLMQPLSLQQLTPCAQPDEFNDADARDLKHTKVAWVDGQNSRGFFMVDHDRDLSVLSIKRRLSRLLVWRSNDEWRRQRPRAGPCAEMLACTVAIRGAARFYEACGLGAWRAQSPTRSTGEGPYKSTSGRFERLGPVNQAETMILPDPIISQNVM